MPASVTLAAVHLSQKKTKPATGFAGGRDDGHWPLVIPSTASLRVRENPRRQLSIDLREEAVK
jgi:hypothetical protein